MINGKTNLIKMLKKSQKLDMSCWLSELYSSKIFTQRTCHFTDWIFSSSHSAVFFSVLNYIDHRLPILFLIQFFFFQVSATSLIGIAADNPKRWKLNGL